MDNAVEKFEKYTLCNGMIKRNEKVLVAFSGGPDSVFLMVMLLCLREKYGIALGAFHLNHNLRQTAERDAAFAEKYCTEAGVALHGFSQPVLRQAEADKVSVEEAGRAARYALMTRLRKEFGYTKAATGHHMDDNAETVLMRIIRGTGAEGLEGIPPVKDGWIIRPLLAFTKDEIVKYLEERHIAYMTDETNADTDYFRNRVRCEIIPLMKRDNPLLSQSISRMCGVIRTDNAFIRSSAENAAIKIQGETASVSYEAVLKYHEAVRYAVIMNMARAVGITKDYSHANIGPLMKMLDQPQTTSWDIHLPGVVFRRRYDVLSVCTKADTPEAASFNCKIKVPSMHIFSAAGLYVKIYRTKNVKNIRNEFIKYIDYAKIKNILVLRNRCEGDTFVKFGQNGHKMLKKYFIDQKIAREVRAHVPILTDGDDIVCICGYEIDDRYKADETTRDYLVIECGGTEK